MGLAMKQVKDDCRGMDSRLAEMLLDPEDVPAKVQSHIAGCERCGSELEELRATMALLDSWQAPEPNPYFLTRLDARMREERAAEPASLPTRWIERMQAYFAYGPQTHVRPLAAMALTALLLLGGGTYMGYTSWDPAPPPTGQATAVVGDLQTMDKNAQLLDQLEELSANNGPND
jgi:hypothetical protein